MFVKSSNKDARLLFDFQKTRANMELIDPSRQIDTNNDKNSKFELKANSSVKAKLRCKAKYANRVSGRYFSENIGHFYVRRKIFLAPKK